MPAPEPAPTSTTVVPEPPPPDPTATTTVPEPPPPEPPPPDPADSFDALRQTCVDQINSYRATVGLDALTRADHAIELCSDAGAELDATTYATTGVAHASSGDCDGMNAQNTCPGWDPTSYGGEEAALRACLGMMWAEGAPAVGRTACIDDRYGCFQEHGHYLNMSSPTAGVVSCGFFRMPNGDVWMNQDFGR
jgi:hypothetical protein